MAALFNFLIHFDVVDPGIIGGGSNITTIALIAGVIVLALVLIRVFFKKK